MDFAGYGTNEPVVYGFKHAPWSWRIKRASFGEEYDHDKLFVGYTVTTHPDGTRTQEISITDAILAQEEIWLTFAGSNIPATFSSDKKDILKMDDVGERTKGLYFPYRLLEDKPLFMEKLSKLPPDMVDELWGAVQRVNRHWMPPLARVALAIQEQGERAESRESVESPHESGETGSEDQSSEE